jgi:uncharacterized membrane protein YidH (DUF202 family)
MVEIAFFLGLFFILKGFIQIFFWTKLPFGNKEAVENNYRNLGFFSIAIGLVSLILSFLEYQHVISVAKLVEQKDALKIALLGLMIIVFGRYLFGFLGRK